MVDPRWNEIFRHRSWNQWPSEDAIRFMAEHFKLCRLDTGPLILDCGCATGGNLSMLGSFGRVVGLDASLEALRRTYIQQRNPVTCADVEYLPFASNTFDVVIEVECLYWMGLEAARQSIAEILRVLKPGGWLFAKTFAPGTGVSKTSFPIQARTPGDIATLYQSFGIVECGIIQRHFKQQIHREWLLECQK